jgi:hypothetical protein
MKGSAAYGSVTQLLYARRVYPTLLLTGKNLSIAMLEKYGENSMALLVDEGGQF